MKTKISWLWALMLVGAIFYVIQLNKALAQQAQLAQVQQPDKVFTLRATMTGSASRAQIQPSKAQALSAVRGAIPGQPSKEEALKAVQAQLPTVAPALVAPSWLDLSDKQILARIANETDEEDDYTSRLAKWLGWDGTEYTNKFNLAKFKAWKTHYKIGKKVISITSFLSAEERKNIRGNAVEELSVPTTVPPSTLDKILTQLADQAFGEDDDTFRLKKWLGWDGTNYANEINLAAFKAWKKLKKIGKVSTTSFLSADEWSKHRSRAVKELKVPTP